MSFSPPRSVPLFCGATGFVFQTAFELFGEYPLAGAEVRNLGDVKWLATEDKKPGKGTGRHIACFRLK